MHASLSAIPLEIRRDIFGYCKNDDLINLATCSKAYHDEMMPILWNDVEVKWDDLSGSYSVYTSQALRHFKHASRLSFIGGYQRGEHGENALRSFVVGSILKNCCQYRLKSLSIRGFIGEDLPTFASKMVPNIESLTISYQYHMNAAPLPDSIWNFRCLRYLSLYFCRSISDCHIKKISEDGNLLSLQLQECSKLTPACFEYISRITGLVEFSFLTYSEEIGNQISANIKTIIKTTNLVALDLEHCNAEVVFEKADEDLKYLEYLSLYETFITDTTVESISMLLNLKFLCLDNANLTFTISNQALAYISRLTSLEYLDVRCCDVTMAGLHQIANLTELVYLDISCRDDDYTLNETTLKNVLKNLTKLRCLNLDRLDRTNDECLCVVSELHQLEALSLRLPFEHRVTDRGLQYLKQLKRLRYFQLDWLSNQRPPGLTEEGTSGLGELKDFIDYKYKTRYFISQ